MKRYSEGIKERMVKRLTSHGGPSSSQLEIEVGIPRQTLSRWVQEYANVGGMEKKAKRTQDWSAEEKFEALMKAQGLEGEELGKYLRQKGLYSADLERWREEFIHGAKVTVRRGRPKLDPELIEARKREKVLRRELRRKEKALAEASALLVLKKKADLIWGVQEEDESE